MAPRVPTRIKEVVYTISPFETTVLSGLWKDLPQKLTRKWNEVRSCAAWPAAGERLQQLTHACCAALDGRRHAAHSNIRHHVVHPWCAYWLGPASSA